MKKNFKKSKFVIVPALATLVLTGVASVTGTVAWFAATRTVTATGMVLKAKSGSNLLIASDTLTNPTQLADSKFSSSMTLTSKNTTELKPASTVNAKDFFYTDKAKADGSKESGNYTQVTENNTYYVDYVFELKAINTESTEQNIYINQLEIKYNENWATGNLAKAVKAFRAGFFIEAAGTTKNSEFKLGTTDDNTLVTSIYTPEGAENQTKYNNVNKAVKSTNELDTVNYVSKATVLTSVAVNSTKYYKAICRIWLEGEDKNCTNELFSTATENWSVNLGLTLSTTAEPMSGKAVKNIQVAAKTTGEKD